MIRTVVGAAAASERQSVMPQNHAEHPFDQWIAQFSSASPAQREAMLAVWNRIVGKAVDAAVQERDAFVRAGEYEYAVMARDMAELFGLNALPPKGLPGETSAKFLSEWLRRNPPMQRTGDEGSR